MLNDAQLTKEMMCATHTGLMTHRRSHNHQRHVSLRIQGFYLVPFFRETHRCLHTRRLLVAHAANHMGHTPTAVIGRNRQRSFHHFQHLTKIKPHCLQATDYMLLTSYLNIWMFLHSFRKFVAIFGFLFIILPSFL